VCRICKEELPLESFSWSWKAKGNRYYECKTCQKEQRSTRIEILRERDRSYRERDRGYCVLKYTEEYEKIYQQIIQKQRRDLPEVKEKTTKYQADYNRANRESRSAKRKERLKKDPLFKLTTSIRSTIGGAFKRTCQGVFCKEEGTARILGCSFEFFTSHIASQFTEGMTLENYGEWHLDHIIPLATATTREDVVRLNHYTNFQPLWAKDNLSKGSKIIQ